VLVTADIRAAAIYDLFGTEHRHLGEAA